MNRLTERLENGLATVQEEMCYDIWFGYSTGNAIGRLAEYEDLEEKGLLVRLPCKTYDNVYRVCGKNIEIEKVVGFYVLGTEVYYDFGWAQFNINNRDIFLTREEAEERLKH